MKELRITRTITNRDNIALDKYLSDIAKFDLITADEESVLAGKIRMGSEEALSKLVNANLRFVVSVAKQHQGHGIPLSDLISEGNYGLIKAARRFDETRGFKFISYAVWWIRQSMMQCIAEKGRTIRLPVNQIANLTKLNKAKSELEQRVEREPTTDEIAEQLDIATQSVEFSTMIASYPQSIDAPLRDGETSTLHDKLPVDEGKMADEDLLMESLAYDIQCSLSTLSKLERAIILEFFGIGFQQAGSLATIGARHNLTSERIRQLKRDALNKLRGRMSNRILEN